MWKIFSANRYAPKDQYNSTQGERPSGGQYPPNMKGYIPNITSPERRPFSPFQPPVRQGMSDQQPQQVLYSDLDRGGEKWYPAKIIDPTQQKLIPPPASTKGPGSSKSGFMSYDPVYKYPQFNNADMEMHTVPADTRYGNL